MVWSYLQIMVPANTIIEHDSITFFKNYDCVMYFVYRAFSNVTYVLACVLCFHNVLVQLCNDLLCFVSLIHV
jgi:hypothetical protein